MLDRFRRRISYWLRRRDRRRYGLMPDPMLIDNVVWLPAAEKNGDGVWERTR